MVRAATTLCRSGCTDPVRLATRMSDRREHSHRLSTVSCWSASCWLLPRPSTRWTRRRSPSRLWHRHCDASRMRWSLLAATAVILLAGCGIPDPAPRRTAMPSAEATPSPTRMASASQGQFGPVHRMTVDEAFPEGVATCENIDQMLASGERSDVGYRVSFPDAWFTNAEAPESPELQAACTLFHPQPFDPTPPSTVAIRIDMPPGGDISIGMGGTSLEDADATISEYTVADMPALRVAFNDDPSLLWVVGIGGSLPGVGNDRPTWRSASVLPTPTSLPRS